MKNEKSEFALMLVLSVVTSVILLGTSKASGKIRQTFTIEWTQAPIVSVLMITLVLMCLVLAFYDYKKPAAGAELPRQIPILFRSLSLVCLMLVGAAIVGDLG